MIRELTVAEIAAYLERARRVPTATLRLLERDSRASVARLAAHYAAGQAAAVESGCGSAPSIARTGGAPPPAASSRGWTKSGGGRSPGPCTPVPLILGQHILIAGPTTTGLTSRGARGARCRDSRPGHRGGRRGGDRRRNRPVQYPRCLAAGDAAGGGGAHPRAAVSLGGRPGSGCRAPRARDRRAGEMRLCASISAASIVAKVARDRVMCALHERYPAYRFVQRATGRASISTP